MRSRSEDRSYLLEPVQHGTPLNPIEGLDFAIDSHHEWKEYFFVDLHWHPEIEFIYIEKGRFSAEVNLDQTELFPGDFMFAGSEDIHALKSLDRESHHKALIFHPKVLSFSYEDEFQRDVIGPLLSGDQTFPHYLKKDDPAYTRLAPLLSACMFLSGKDDTEWYFAEKLRLLSLLYSMKEYDFLLPAQSLISPSEQAKIERFKQITSYMDLHLSENISLDELAGLTSTNSQYLCRFFKEISGQSPIQYLIGRRIETAASLLRETDRSILDISMECGFDNVSYFIRKFKQLKGLTPGAYRESDI